MTNIAIRCPRCQADYSVMTRVDLYGDYQACSMCGWAGKTYTPRNKTEARAETSPDTFHPTRAAPLWESDQRIDRRVITPTRVNQKRENMLMGGSQGIYTVTVWIPEKYKRRAKNPRMFPIDITYSQEHKPPSQGGWYALCMWIDGWPKDWYATPVRRGAKDKVNQLTRLFEAKVGMRSKHVREAIIIALESQEEML